MHPFMKQISVTYRCAMRYRERELAESGVLGCQTPYLTALYRRPGLTQEELARELNVNKSSVTRQLAALEEKGYVRRDSDPADKRTLRVFLTADGAGLIGRIFDCYHDWNAYLTQDLTDGEQQELSRLMAHIAARAEAYVKGACDECAPSGDI